MSAFDIMTSQLDKTSTDQEKLQYIQQSLNMYSCIAFTQQTHNG